MYEVLAYLKFFESFDDEETAEDKIKWIVLSRTFKIPFVPMEGMSLGWGDEPHYEIEEVVWNMDHMVFVLYGLPVPLSKENYDETVRDVLEAGNWEFFEDENNEHGCNCGNCEGDGDGGDHENNNLLN